MRQYALAVALALGGCSFVFPPPAPVAPSAVTIQDPMSFLVQDAPGGAPLKASDQLVQRRHDWGLGSNYEIDDSALADGGASAIQTFSFAPWGPFAAANGDGGQVLTPGADGYVRATETQDGGTPGMQNFVGQGCGGTGWIVFGTDAPTGSWRSVVATLGNEPTAAACPLFLNPAYTRYRLEQVVFPFTVNGAPQTITVPSVISEHYDSFDVLTAHAMERMYMGQGYGLLFWSAWTRTPPTSDLSARCGFGIAFSVAPADGWYMDDCRVYTNLFAPTPGSPATVDAFGWPP